MIDSGSSSTFIKQSAAEKLNLFIIPKSRTIPLADNNLVAKIIGEVVINIEFNGREHRGVVAEVIKDLCTDIIIGKDTLKKHKRVIFNFNGSKEDLVLGAVNSNPNDVSSDATPLPFCTVGIPSPPLFTHLSDKIKPVATKSRRQSPADRQFIKAELLRLQKQGIIKPSISPWRAQAFVTKETSTHKRRMVVDYSETINLFTELDAYPMPNPVDMVQELSQYQYFSTFDLKSAYHQVPIQQADQKYTAFEADGQLWEFTRIPFGITNGVSAFQRTMDKVVLTENLKDTFVYVDNITIAGRSKEEHDQNVKKFHAAREKYNLTLNSDKTISCAQSITLLGYNVSNNSISPDQRRLQPLLDMPPPTNLKSQKRVIGMFSYYSKFIDKFSEKIRPLNKNTTFPVPKSVVDAFNILKEDLKNATLQPIDPEAPFVVETDASDFCIAATLNQNGRPVAFFSRTLKNNEIKHHSVEKEAAAIVESIRDWRHFLIGRKFKLITDQRSISFMFDNRRRSKIKNAKIARWRLELSQYKYDISYRPGSENPVADTFSRIAAMCHPLQELRNLHEQLCHPGITRLSHFVRQRNLPFSQEQIKTVTNTCKSCMFHKPKFLNYQGTLINATAPFQKLNIDFKGPLPPSKKGNCFLLTLIDEYSRFPFAYPCKDTKSSTINQCFNNLFSMFGMPEMVHNDRGTDFLSEETQSYLLSKSIATSKTSRYNPKCNGQVERLNGTLWKAIQVTLHSRNLKQSDWEDVLPDALHSIRSLLCTTTNETPHERMFNYTRKSTSGRSIPSWVKPGPIYIRNQPRKSKNDPIVTSATLIHANPEYAHVRLQSGVETTVNLRDIAQHPETLRDFEPVQNTQTDIMNSEVPLDEISLETQTVTHVTPPLEPENIINTKEGTIDDESPNLRRSSRVSKTPKRFDDFVMK